jgi:hypothetical protein
MRQVFQATKEALSKSMVLAHPQEIETGPATDKTWYAVFDTELFACVSGICHSYLLDGRWFTLFTDHKPLTFALVKVAEMWTACQCWHLSYVAEFTSNIRHIGGTDNVVGDMLSRPSPTTAELSQHQGSQGLQPHLVASPIRGS